jgi:hypothetical protein
MFKKVKRGREEIRAGGGGDREIEREPEYERKSKR